MNALARPVPAAGLTTADRWLAALLLFTGLVIRVLYVLHFRVDSDEPQHLHVVWAWANGMLPYRDVFDNHTPLFQALCAPLFKVLGVRPDILIPMRMAMLPIYAATLFFVWRIAATLFSPRIALWTAALTAFCPFYYRPFEAAPYFFASIEFRPDQLWTLLWLATLFVFISGQATPRRALVAGLLLGASFAVSMKTSLYLLTLTFSFIGALLARRAMGGEKLVWSRLIRCAGAGLLGIVIVPALVVLFFVANGAGKDMYYCVIKHNVMPHPHQIGPLLKNTAHWLLWMPDAVIGCWIITRLQFSVPVRTRIAFIYLAGVLFYQTLAAYWPILTAEDFIPFFPAMMITAGAAIVALAGLISRGLRLPGMILPALCVAGELAYIVTEPHGAPTDPRTGIVVAEQRGTGADGQKLLPIGDGSGANSPFVNQTTDRVGLVADVLKLTEPTDVVMDAKGETIYRERASKLVMEALTIKRLLLGLKDGGVEDDIVDGLIKNRTPVLSSRRMTAKAHQFIQANYILVAWRIKALGQWVRLGNQKLSVPSEFETVIPARYTLVTPSGTATGTLDGTPFTGPRDLEPGHHEFIMSGTPDKVALVWATAIERGYSPFNKIPRDYTTPQD